MLGWFCTTHKVVAFLSSLVNVLDREMELSRKEYRVAVGSDDGIRVKTEDGSMVLIPGLELGVDGQCLLQIESSWRFTTRKT